MAIFIVYQLGRGFIDMANMMAIPGKVVAPGGGLLNGVHRTSIDNPWMARALTPLSVILNKRLKEMLLLPVTDKLITVKGKN